MKRRQGDLSTRLIAYGTLGATWLLITACAVVAIAGGKSVFWTLLPWGIATAIYIEGFHKSKL